MKTILGGIGVVLSTCIALALGGGAGPFNLYGLNDYASAPYQDITGRTTASAPSSTGLGIFIVAGQSLAANDGVTLYTPTNAANCLNLNIYNGIIYRLKDPVIGTTGTAGSYIGRLCDSLINAGKYTNVLMVPIAIGGTSVGQWSSAGAINNVNPGWYSHRLVVALNRVRQQGYQQPTAFLWDQGNEDASAGTSSANYQSRFLNVQTTLSGSGYNGPWYIATETMNANVVNATIQGAQAALVDNITRFAGANIDSLTGGTNRQVDGTHLTDAGNSSAATLWKNALP